MTSEKSITKAKISKRLLKEFDETRKERERCAETINWLLGQLVNNLPVHVHSVTYRCKTRESFKKKLGRPDKNYRSLTDITDLVGLRLTTYFEDDIDQIAEMIENEFEIDRENSVDKRASHAPDGWIHVFTLCGYNV